MGVKSGITQALHIGAQVVSALQVRAVIKLFPPQDRGMVITTCLDPECVLLDGSHLVAAHLVNDVREVLHELEGVFLLEEVPLLLTPLHEINGINDYDALV